MRRGLKIVGILTVAVFVLAACNHDDNPITTVKDTQADVAAQAASEINFSSNAEIENIKRRLELTSQPGLAGFVALMNETGQVVWYGGMIGKITSSGKRLTPVWALTRADRGEYNGDFVVPAASDEGTSGSSSPYIFFWTVNGQYMQWNGKYLYSDQPFRLNVTPLMLSIVDDIDKVQTQN